MTDNGAMGDAASLVTIGDFARMTQLSVKSLRHYHELGLLVPVAVDPYSGYRRYDLGQLPTAQVIRRLRDLDMPLPQIRAVLATSDIEQRNAAIARHLRTQERELDRLAATVASLRGLLDEDRAGPAEIRLERVPAQTALGVRRQVGPDSFLEWLPQATRLLGTAAGTHAAGNPGAIFEEPFFTEEAGLVTVHQPVQALPLRGPGQQLPAEVEVVELPAGDFAVIEYQGCGVDLDRAYANLGSFVTERAIGIAGPIRERFLPSGPTSRLEICWPVFRVDSGNDGG